MKRITLTDDQFNMLKEIISHSDSNAPGNESLARMFPDKADFYRQEEFRRQAFDAAIDAAEIIV